MSRLLGDTGQQVPVLTATHVGRGMDGHQGRSVLLQQSKFNILASGRDGQQVKSQRWLSGLRSGIKNIIGRGDGESSGSGGGCPGREVKDRRGQEGKDPHLGSQEGGTFRRLWANTSKAAKMSEIRD